MALAHIVSYTCLCLFLFLAKLSLLSHAKPSPFEFIKQLQGSHKGETVKGLHNLKGYLEQFGYLNKNHTQNQTNADDNDAFDDTLESAIKTYQQNYNIDPTGTLDSQTVTTMTMTRCGVPDIENGTNHMHGGGRKNIGLHIISHYSFFPNEPKWPPSKYNLTYALPFFQDPRIVAAVGRAFDNWANATHFNFSKARSFSAADLKISFQRGFHGDGAPFDGRGGIIAHAFAPTNGWFHYDADERYSIGAVQGAFDLETVALHEIGHLLGLGHSSVQNAIMFPTISTGVTKGLNEDDIQGIKDLYNM